MHIIMGLGNDVFNELKKTVINLDNDESDNDVIKFNVAEDIKKLEGVGPVDNRLSTD